MLLEMDREGFRRFQFEGTLALLAHPVEPAAAEQKNQNDNDKESLC
jgi:hypothetical protein